MATMGFVFHDREPGRNGLFDILADFGERTTLREASRKSWNLCGVIPSFVFFYVDSNFHVRSIALLSHQNNTARRIKGHIKTAFLLKILHADA
jgi:hypothetical protein